MTHYWFIAAKNRQSSKLALFTFLIAFVVILLGAYTRLTDAGLSCPDWPNCYGYLTAPHTSSQLQNAAHQFPLAPINITKARTEMTHRYIAGMEGILIVILAISILFTRKTNDNHSLIISITLICLVLTQIMLGMLTVTEKLKPIIVLSHLLTGLSILGLLWWIFLLSRYKKHAYIVHPTKMPSTRWFWLGFFILITQIALGGWTSTHYAGLACVDFPYCNGQLFPAMQWSNLNQDLITIHMLHRIGALITAAYLSLFAFYLLPNPALRIQASLILLLIISQVTLGILNIVWLRPIWIALIHHAIAIILLLTIISSLVKVHHETKSLYRF